MPSPPSQLPAALPARFAFFDQIPVLLCHPNNISPAPTVIWLHGRTASKELDPGRYLRWVRAGIAACAIDLPSHGQRSDPARQLRTATFDTLRQAVGDIDAVVSHLARDPLFDIARLAIGGMSLGGMVALRRLCDPHPFRCAAVEGTSGDLAFLIETAAPTTDDSTDRPAPNAEKAENAPTLELLNPIQNLRNWRPIPLLALHTEADRIVDISGQRHFLEALRTHYAEEHADPEDIQFRTWPVTGAPDEHIGFGRFSNEAKNIQTSFFHQHLL